MIEKLFSWFRFLEEAFGPSVLLSSSALLSSRADAGLGVQECRSAGVQKQGGIGESVRTGGGGESQQQQWMWQVEHIVKFIIGEIIYLSRLINYRIKMDYAKHGHDIICMSLSRVLTPVSLLLDISTGPWSPPVLSLLAVGLLLDISTVPWSPPVLSLLAG